MRWELVAGKIMKHGARACLLASLVAAAAVGQRTSAPPTAWRLESATLTYRVSDAVEKVVGASQSAQGAGTCERQQCRFVATAPVASFHSGNSRRDRQMLKSVRAAQFPTVRVTTILAPAQIHPGPLVANLAVEFAGERRVYSRVLVLLKRNGTRWELTGTIPVTLSDFHITPPRILFLTLRNPAPVTVDLVWQEAAAPRTVARTRLL